MVFKKGNQLWKRKKNFKHSDKTKKKIRDAKKGGISPMKGTKGILKSNSGSFKKGHVAWNKGKKGLSKGFTGKHSEESKQKNREKHLGKSTWNKGKKLTIEHRIKLSLAHTQEKEFIGFRNKLVRQIRLLIEYIVWRRLVFERDNYTCQDCEEKGYIEAHHKKPFHKILIDNNIKTLDEAKDCQELWMVKNGITYCRKCHIKNDKFIGRKICVPTQQSKE